MGFHSGFTFIWREKTPRCVPLLHFTGWVQWKFLIREHLENTWARPPCGRRRSLPCYYWSLSGAQRTALRVEVGVCKGVGYCVPEQRFQKEERPPGNDTHHRAGFRGFRRFHSAQSHWGGSLDPEGVVKEFQANFHRDDTLENALSRAALLTAPRPTGLVWG